MKLHFAQWKSLFFAGLAVGCFPLMQMQSAAQGQMIVFSSPDGQITTNAPLPIAQVPQSSEPLPDLPGEAPQGLFKPPTPVAPYVPLISGPAYRQDNVQPRDDFQNPMDQRKHMGVPTVEQIFGLPERNAFNGKKNSLLDPMQSEYGINGATNMTSADGVEASSWAKLLSDNSNPSGDGTTSSNSTDKTSGLFGGFFDSTPKNNVKDSLFGSHNDQADDTGFGSSPASAQQSTWDSFVNGTPAPAESSPNFSTPNPSASSGLNSQSPFNQLPQSSGFNSTLPQVPTPPSVPGQNYNSMQPATPSWAPKPPPWLSSTPAIGTMPERKF